MMDASCSSSAPQQPDLRVRIGSMITPDRFWLIRYRESLELSALEQDLADYLAGQGRRSHPEVESVVPGALVAVSTQDLRQWKRAKVVTPIAKFLAGSQAKFLLLDYGETTDYTPLRNVRLLPETFLTRLKPQAKELQVRFVDAAKSILPVLSYRSFFTIFAKFGHFCPF